MSSTPLTVLLDTHHIRVTNNDPIEASVINVISAVTGKNSNDSAVAFKRLCEKYPEVTSGCRNHKFPGKGQRDTPVANARGIWKIITLLPGKAAAIFRDKSGDVMIRYLGGDESLIAEIRGNRAMQEQLAVENPEHPLRFIGKTVEAETKNEFNALEFERMKLEIEERKFRLKRMQIEFADQLMESFAPDERDLLFIKDAKRTCMRDMFGATMLTNADGEQQLMPLFRRELTIGDVAKSLDLPYKSLDVLKTYGTACARLYRAEHNGESPPKRDQNVGGAIRKVNCYFEEHKDLLIRGIMSTQE